MKKIVILASALILGGTAYAQDASMQPPASGSSMPATPDASMPAAGGSSMPASPDGSMPAASTPDASAPGGMTPDASAPAGGMSGTGQASATDDSSLPMCSKTVTDKCRQGSGTGHHKAMHHKK